MRTAGARRQIQAVDSEREAERESKHDMEKEQVNERLKVTDRKRSGGEKNSRGTEREIKKRD